VKIISQLTTKDMVYTNYFWGMNWLWWFVWIIMLFWIFAIPYDIPGQRMKKDSPLDILKKRLAAGEIQTEEYQEKKLILEADLAKSSF
jgi:putative membrane protein